MQSETIRSQAPVSEVLDSCSATCQLQLCLIGIIIKTLILNPTLASSQALDFKSYARPQSDSTRLNRKPSTPALKQELGLKTKCKAGTQLTHQRAKAPDPKVRTQGSRIWEKVLLRLWGMLSFCQMFFFSICECVPTTRSCALMKVSNLLPTPLFSSQHGRTSLFPLRPLS